MQQLCYIPLVRHQRSPYLKNQQASSMALISPHVVHPVVYLIFRWHETNSRRQWGSACTPSRPPFVSGLGSCRGRWSGPSTTSSPCVLWRERPTVATIRAFSCGRNFLYRRVLAPPRRSPHYATRCEFYWSGWMAEWHFVLPTTTMYI